MSYILDALKKSEAERRRDLAPSLLDPQVVHRPRSRIGTWLALGLFVNAALVAGWLLWPKMPGTSPAVSAASPVPASNTAMAESNMTAPPTVNALPPELPDAASSTAALPLVTATPSMVTVAAPAPAPAITAPAAAPVPLNALSAGERQRFANIEFSTHLYADDPDLRAVTMGGRRFREGDVVAPEVSIQEITEDGVILRHQSLLVEVSLLQDWRI